MLELALKEFSPKFFVAIVIYPNFVMCSNVICGVLLTLLLVLPQYRFYYVTSCHLTFIFCSEYVKGATSRGVFYFRSIPC